MNYANIDKFEYRNGEGIGISLFVSGCNFHCKDCFNEKAWDFSYGEEWTEETEKHLIELLRDEHVQRFSILGGEPLCDENVRDVLNIIAHVKISCPNIRIWIYTGYTTELKVIPMLIPKLDDGSRYSYFWCDPISKKHECFDYARELAIGAADILVDGQFKTELKDLSLKFRGSKNQRIIDIQKSKTEKQIILWRE